MFRQRGSRQLPPWSARGRSFVGWVVHRADSVCAKLICPYPVAASAARAFGVLAQANLVARTEIQIVDVVMTALQPQASILADRDLTPSSLFRLRPYGLSLVRRSPDLSATGNDSIRVRGYKEEGRRPRGSTSPMNELDRFHPVSGVVDGMPSVASTPLSRSRKSATGSQLLNDRPTCVGVVLAHRGAESGGVRP